MAHRFWKSLVFVAGACLLVAVFVPWAMAKGGPKQQPSIESLTPSVGVQGQTLSVTIKGTHFNGVTGVSFGAGITVNSFIVNSAKKITANITISGAAALGPYDLTLNSSAGNITGNDVFTVAAASSCANVNVSTTPGSVTFDKIDRQRKIYLLVQNLSALDITVASVVVQTASYKIHQISPPMPRVVKAGKSRSFNIRVRGNVLGTLTSPFFEVTIVCGNAFAVVAASPIGNPIVEEFNAQRETRSGKSFISTQIELYNLNGQVVLRAEGAEQALVSSTLEHWANGVYLYVVTTRKTDGATLCREVRKLIVQH